MKTYMVTFRRLGKDNYTKFDDFHKAINFAEHMCKRYESKAEVRNYYTEELVYVTEPEINLDKELRI
jgi:hypothetical protein